MPYIEFNRRVQVDGFETPQTPGELNYKLTLLCTQYFREHGGRYQQINDIVGALESCKLEFYRRVAAPYEDDKKWQNGDVYECRANF